MGKKELKLKWDRARRMIAMALVLCMLLCDGPLPAIAQESQNLPESEPVQTESIQSEENPAAENQQEPLKDSAVPETEASAEPQTEAVPAESEISAAETVPVETAVQIPSETVTEPAEVPSEPETEPTEVPSEPKTEPMEEPGKLVPSTEPENSDTSVYESGVLDLSTFAWQLKIYNYLTFLNANQQLVVSDGSYSLKGKAENTVVIGDQTYEGEIPQMVNPAPMDSDIPVTLLGADLPLQICPVFGGSRQVVLTAETGSHISSLDILDQGKLDIVLNGDMAIDIVTMGNGSLLTVHPNGHTLTIGEVSGSGDLQTFGAGTISFKGTATFNNISVNNSTILTAGDLVAQQSIISVDGDIQGAAGTETVRAGNKISLTGGSARNLLLVGFTDAVGDVSISLDRTAFNHVELVGAGYTCNAKVSFSGNPSTSFETSYSYDNDIVYTYQNKVIPPEADWPTSFRVAGSAAEYHIVGSLSGEGFTKGNVYLPSYLLDGYNSKGWLVNKETEPFVMLPDGLRGTVTLTARMVPAEIALTWDLGYDPDEKSNDAPIPQRLTEETVLYGTEVQLLPRFRFGYVFAGYKVLSGAEPGTKILGTEIPSYQFQIEDLTKNPVTDQYTLKLEAQWALDQFPIRFQIQHKESEISVDGQNWYTPAQFAADHDSVEYTEEGRLLTFTNQHQIPYGMTLEAFLNEKLGGIPALRDISGNQERFAAWGKLSGQAVTGDMAYSITGGLLDLKDSTLQKYNEDLHSKPLTLVDQWGKARYDLTLVDCPDNWDILVDNKVQQKPASGVLSIEEGAYVTFRCSSTNRMGFGLWRLTQGSGTIDPTERTYTDGDPYLLYDFVMPSANVLATYRGNQEIWIDLYPSPITFEEKVEHNNRKLDGFWYNEPLAEMTPTFFDEAKQAYFYAWELIRPFYVTSNNMATANPLTLVNAMQVHLRDCNLTATDAYANKLIGRTMDGVCWEYKTQSNDTPTAENAWTPYGNIVMDHSKYSQYETRFYIHGTNQIAGIFQSQYRPARSNKSTVTLTGQPGTDPCLNLGSIWGNMDAIFQSMNIGELPEDQDPCEYLAYVTGGALPSADVSFNNCRIDAPRKRVYTASGYIRINNTDALLGSIRYSYNIYVGGNSFVHLLHDLTGHYYGITLSGSSSVVVDGDMGIQGYESNGSTISTSGYMIVKGNLMDSGTFSMTSGTVIVNALAIAAECDIAGGTLIANQIVNLPCKRMVPNNTDGSYHEITGGSAGGPVRSTANQNRDELPFLTYANLASWQTKYTLRGGNVYLLGYRRGGSSWDRTLTATDPENPISAVLGACTQDERGRYDLSALTDSFLQQQVQAAAAPQSECWVVGDSTFTTDQKRSREVLLSGSNVYAAGNLTFFNDTTISGGIVHSYGSISSKRDMVIKGSADVKAREVGNAYHLTVENGDRLTRWQQTRIEGGSVTADRLGAVDKTYFGAEQSRSNLRISGGTVQAASLEQDVYMNYIVGSLFTRPEGLPDSLHYQGDSLSGTMTLDPAAVQVFTNPAGGFWKLNTPSGPVITQVETDGRLMNAQELIPGENGYDRDLIALHAQKEFYNLVVRDGEELIFRAAAGGVQFPLGPGHTTAEVQGGKEVILTVPANMVHKTVVWYYDGSGILHNVGYHADPASNTVSFIMPTSDAEVWITEELPLDISQYDISFTSAGFDISRDPDRPADKIFDYQGSLRIIQSNIDGTKYSSMDGNGMPFRNAIGTRSGAYDARLATKHTMEFLPGSAEAFGRRVTIDQILQTGNGDGFGTVIADGEQVELCISGAVQLYPIKLPEHANLTVLGKEGQSKDKLFFDPDTNKHLIVYNDQGRAGNVHFDNLHFLLYSGYILNRADRLSFQNCDMDLSWYAYNAIASEVNTIDMDTCDLEIRFRSDTGPAPFRQCGQSTLNFRNSRVYYDYGAGRAGVAFFAGLKNVTADHTSFEFDMLESTKKTVHTESLVHHTLPKSIVLTNRSSIKAEHRLMLKNLELTDSDLEITYGSGTYDGFLLCPEMTVNGNSNVKAKYILTSGFYYGNLTNIQDVKNCLLQNKNILDGSAQKNGDFLSHVPTGLVINGGNVQAEKLIGADRNGKITINGGTVTAPAIGTQGNIYGYAGVIPEVGSNFVYTSKRTPAKDHNTVININGGQVNIPQNGYLGGMRTKIHMTDGQVILGNNAVLGMNEEQKGILERQASANQEKLTNACAFSLTGGTVQSADLTAGTGSVSVPYGAVSVSNTGAVNVYDLRSENGSVSIADTGTGYENIYTGTDKHDQEVGVMVRHELKAQNILIQNGASVYAAGAYSDAPKGEKGSIRVETGTAGSHLYIGDLGFGNQGDGGGTMDVEDQSQIHGGQQYSITYVLNDTNRVAKDPPYPAVHDNPRFYRHTRQNEEIVFQPASRGDFYIFDGWYMTEDFSGPRIPSISTALERNVVLYAKWTPATVKFQISVSNQVIPDLEKSYDATKGTYDEATDIYTYDRYVEVAYGSTIIGAAKGQINLQDYAFTAYTPTQLQAADGRFQGEPEITSNTVLTKNFLEKYLKDHPEEPFKLVVTNAAPNFLLIGFYRNLQSGRPIQSRFVPHVPNIGAVYSDHAKINEPLKKTQWVMNGDQLISMKAPGYTFEGWYEDGDFTKDPITPQYMVLKPEQEVPDQQGMEQPQRQFKAKWTPKVYQVIFDAGEGNRITKENSEPDETVTDHQLRASIVYDTVLHGNIQWSDTPEVQNSLLPHGWKQGEVFVGWSLDGTDQTLIQKNTELNLTDIGEKYLKEAKGNTQEIALTLHAVYRHVEVTFYLEGGYWTNQYTGDPEIRNDIQYEQPFPGYTMTGDVNAPVYEIHKTSVSDFQAKLASAGGVTADYKNFYDLQDYRHSLMRKGYTFQGWQDQDGNEIRTLPDFRDIEVHAQWQANEYDVNLLPWDDQKLSSNFYDCLFCHVAASSYHVVVDQPILEDGSEKWPPRSEDSPWYAYNNDGTPADQVTQESRRMVLGFTFDSLNPGDNRQGQPGYDAYTRYAATVLTLQGKQLLFQCQRGNTVGTTFRIPADRDYYETAIPGTNVVPDYPDGSSIDLYAIYRERSLVFTEYLNTGIGSQEKILAVYPYSTYVNYPSQYDGWKYWESQGYSLLDWKVNGKNKEADSYPTGTDAKQIFDGKIESWKDAARNLQNYDIFVYTYYVPQVTVKDQLLEVNVDATNTAQPQSHFTYTLPNSFQPGRTRYDVRNPEELPLNLMTKEELDHHLYDNSLDWDPVKPGNQNASNSVAIKIEIINPKEGKLLDSFYMGTGTKIEYTQYPIAAGYTLNFTLYHAWVIDQHQDLKFDVDVTFEGLDKQMLSFEDFTIKFHPTQYKVTYEAALPADVPDTVVTDPKLFTVKASPVNPVTYQRSQTTEYGSSLLAGEHLPRAVGYVGNDSWSWSEQPAVTVGYGQALRLPVQESSGGRILLKTHYDLAKFQLSADGETLKRWTVDYGKPTPLGENPVKVPYDQPVIFTGADTAYPEFIQLHFGDERPAETLDQFAEKDPDQNIYTFHMPECDVSAAYQDVMDLYLEDGTIEIFEDHFVHHHAEGDRTVSWHGSYNILMDPNNNLDDATTTHKTHDTPNTLKLHGNLQGRTVNLGNLSITSPESICLDESTQVRLNTQYNGTASYLEGKNILVPATSSLEVEAPAGQSPFKLTPQKGSAAIGGGKSLKLTNCKIKVIETVAAGQVYSGTWIGGPDTESVALKDCKLFVKDGKGQAMAIDAGTVSLENVDVGSPAMPVTSPVHADSSLNIHGSQIHQTMSSGYALGTDAGTITVSGGSQVDAAVTTPARDLYSGKLILESAREDVVIANRQILDAENGNITITADQVTQGADTHDHRGSYLLVHEKAGTARPTLQVDGLTEAQNIAARTVTLSDTVIHTDTPVEAQQDLTFAGTVTIEEGKTLQVDGSLPLNQDKGNVILTGAFANSGTYAQVGGGFQVQAQVSRNKLDMVLTSTETLVRQDLAVGNLTLKQGTVAGGNDSRIGSLGLSGGVTHVDISGTQVQGGTIGALGRKDETFTFVTWDSTAVLQGQVQRDLYRLAYDVGEKLEYSVDSLPTVLRGTSENGKLDREVMEPAVPQNPVFKPSQEEPEDVFKNWYLVEVSAAGKKILHALHKELKNLPCFQDTLDSLRAEHIQWAAPAAADGTRTLTLHAWIQHPAQAAIEESRKFEALVGEELSVTIPADYAVTAMFTTSEILPDTQYQFHFSNLPVGTGLTLGVLRKGDTLPVFYHAVSADQVIELSAFTRMGSPNEIPGMPEAGDRYLLAADFAGNRTADTVQTIALEIMGEEPVELAKVEYTRVEPASASLSASGAEVTVQWDGDFRYAGKKLFLLAEFDRPISYTAELSLTTGQAVLPCQWLGRDNAVFDLGLDAEQKLTPVSYTAALVESAPADYHISWKLLAAEAAPSVFDRTLANAGGGLIRILQEDQPHMSVQMDSSLSLTRVLTAGKVLTFQVNANRPVTVTGEKQGSVLAGFTGDGSISISGGPEVWQVRVPEEAGTYRIRFSINDETEFDDVYAVFIVK